jgi:molybdopterin-guanine dinucleotide biosynthesis protein A
MLSRVVRLLSEAVAPIVVVAAPGQQLPELPGDVLVARDRREGQGPLEGLAAGLEALQGRADAAYATGCDVPLLVPDFVRYMVAQLGDHDIAVPRDGRFHHPLAAVYRIHTLQLVQRLLSEDRRRPYFLFAEADTLEVPVDDLRDVDPQLSTLENLNSPSEYRRALQRAGYPVPADEA